MKRYYVYSAAIVSWSAGIVQHDLHGLWHQILPWAVSAVVVGLGARLEADYFRFKAAIA